jgi:ammonia channel protein AmtB
MVKVLGYHDAYASGVVHALCGGSCLGILIPLGPRIGRFRADGTARNFHPQNTWLVVVGLFLIVAGFWGFYAACNVPIWDVDPDSSRAFYSATTIYLTPTTLSGMTLNFLLSFAGGMIAGYYLSRGDAYWTFACGIGGIITASAGNDLYHPLQAHLIGMLGAFCIYKLYFWLERRFKIDDAVGAIALHGGGGTLGVLVAGFLLWGYPSSPGADAARITPWGQLIGALIMFFGLGFLPCFVLAKLLARFGLLRIPMEVELAGLDYVGHADIAREVSEIVAYELEVTTSRK